MLTKFKIFEAKQVGILYHWTYLEPLEKILEDDKMWSGLGYISFSRNKNLKYNNRPVKITFDGDRMSDKFKFESHLYHKDVYFKDEAEERIECNGRSEDKSLKDMISGVKKYIIGIDINYEEFIFEDTEKYEKELRKLQRLSPVKIETNIPELKKAGLWKMVKPKYQFLKDPLLASLFKE